MLAFEPAARPIIDPLNEASRGRGGSKVVRAVRGHLGDVEERSDPHFGSERLDGEAPSPGDELGRVLLHGRVVDLQAVVVVQ